MKTLLLIVAVLSCVLADDMFMGVADLPVARILADGSNKNTINQVCLTNLANTKAVQLIGAEGAGQNDITREFVVLLNQDWAACLKNKVGKDTDEI